MSALTEKDRKLIATFKPLFDDIVAEVVEEGRSAEKIGDQSDLVPIDPSDGAIVYWPSRGQGSFFSRLTRRVKSCLLRK